MYYIRAMAQDFCSISGEALTQSWSPSRWAAGAILAESCSEVLTWANDNCDSLGSALSLSFGRKLDDCVWIIRGSEYLSQKLFSYVPCHRQTPCATSLWRTIARAPG